MKYSDKNFKPTDEIATTRSDLDFTGYNGILVNTDTLLRLVLTANSQDIYDDLLLDGRVRSSFQSRRRALTGRGYQINPASDSRSDKKIALFIKEEFERQKMSDILGDLLQNALLKGYGVSEIIYRWRPDGLLGIDAIKSKKSKRFVFDEDGKLRLLTNENMTKGIELPDNKFLCLTYEATSENPYGMGLGQNLYWKVKFKKDVWKMWVQYADRYGIPTPIGKYPPGTTKDLQDKLLEVVDMIQSGQGGVMPEGMLIELLEIKNAAGVQVFEKLIEACNREISIIVQGQHLTQDIGGVGSYSASQTHNEVRLELTAADAEDVCEAFNTQIIPWLVNFNFHTDACPKMEIKIEKEEDINLKAQRDKENAMIVDIPARYFRETYGYPEPKEGEEIAKLKFQDQLAASIGAGNGQKFRKENFGQKELTDTAFSTIRQLAQKSDDYCEFLGRINNERVKWPFVNVYDYLSFARIDPMEELSQNTLNRLKTTEFKNAVREIAQGSRNYDDFINRLGDLSVKFPLVKFEELLSQALFVAELNGFSNSLDENI